MIHKEGEARKSQPKPRKISNESVRIFGTWNGYRTVSKKNTRYAFQSLLNRLETVQQTTESPCLFLICLPRTQPLAMTCDMFTTTYDHPNPRFIWSCLPPIAARWKRAKTVMQTMMQMATPMPLSMAVVTPDAKAYMVSSSVFHHVKWVKSWRSSEFPWVFRPSFLVEKKLGLWKVIKLNWTVVRVKKFLHFVVRSWNSRSVRCVVSSRGLSQPTKGDPKMLVSPGKAPKQSKHESQVLPKNNATEKKHLTLIEILIMVYYNPSLTG